MAEVNEKQLSSSQKAYARKLVTDVYHRRGSAPEVRAAIEAECVMEKEREARAGVMNRDAVSSGWQQEPANSASKNTDNPNSGGAYRKGQGLATETAGKMRRCESFNRRLDEIARRQRAGVDVATMEKLKQEHRDLQRDMSESGC
ncbi:MAG TPA: hypothetical protein VEC35_16130 [Noviherbaspirillum sp.]|nr:hypothetical protein [Noviherbaspirillum sp.]